MVNYRFRFRLVGIERLTNVFREIINGKVATDNLDTEPRNVTLKKWKKKDFNKNWVPQKFPTLMKKTMKFCPQERAQGRQFHTPFCNFSTEYPMIEKYGN